LRRRLAAGLLLGLAGSAHALEYRTTSRPAVLYDAPSTAAAKVAVAGSGLPLEVVVETAGWTKVRDHGGRLTWIEQSAFGNVRNVMVKAEAASVRKQPRPDADIAFLAARGVLLEATGDADGFGWLPVKHADGRTGWLPLFEVWGR
jgi:SH3-like domain-containing protein